MVKIILNSYLRSLVKNTKYTVLNVLGLAIGISAFLLVSIYLKSEVEYDKFHSDYERIYRVLYHSKSPTNDAIWARSGPGMAQVVKEEIPEIDYAVRILAGKNVMDPFSLVSYGEREFLEPNLFYADDDFFKLFSFESMDGTPVEFEDPFSIVLTSSTAQKYFGNTNPIGKVIEISDMGLYTVKAVLKDIPANSHFHFDLIANFNSHDVSKNKDWMWTRVYTYLKVNQKASIEILEKKLNEKLEIAIANKSFSGSSFSEWKASGNFVKLRMQPLENIHLNSSNTSEFEPGGNELNIKLFFLIAVLVLFLACINFINLSISQSLKFGNEIGVRKTFGATRRQIVAQFIVQSIITVFIATIIAIILTFVFFPVLNELLGNSIEPPEFSLLWIPYFFVFILVVGAFAGAYPAFYLSHFTPMKVLKDSIQPDKGGKYKVRFFLIIFQFCTSLCLVTSTIIIYSQIQYMRSKDLGFENKLIVLERANVMGENTELFKQLLVKNEFIESVTASSTVPGNWIGTVNLYPISGSISNRVVVEPIFSDFDFANTYDFEFLEGRSFMQNRASDSLAVIINESALKAFGLKTIEGEYLKGWLSTPHPIVGVVKDFNQGSASDLIKPMVIFANFFPTMQNITIKYSGDDVSEVVANIEAVWDQLKPNEPFIYSYMNDNFDRLYVKEVETGNIILVLSLLGLLISSMGLLGVITAVISQRGKELAVRKVLGATAIEIFISIVNGLGKTLLIATLIAIPITWIVMENWLQHFAYRTSVTPNAFFISFTICFGIAFGVIIFQVLQSVRENPTIRLKAE